MHNQKTTVKISTSAILIALGTVISLICEMIPFLNLPFGGTITLFSMLPVILISWMYGLGWGFGAGFVYAVFQMLVGFKTVSALFTPTSDSYMGISIAFLVILIDYLLAYTSLGLGGIFRKMNSKTGALVLGSIVAMTVCYFFHFFSGLLFYGAWAEWFFTDTVVADLAISKHILNTFSGTGLAAIYSLVYNGCYMIPEIILTTIGAAAISPLKSVRKY